MIYDLDKKDCQILDLLQKDCRMSLTKISKEVGLSVDAVNKRIKKMIDGKVFYPKVQIRARNIGFRNVIEAKVKLQNVSEEDLKEFVEFLEKHRRVVEVFSLSGEWDFSLVIIGKDTFDLSNITNKIRSKFAKLIYAWNESISVRCYKFEEFDMKKLYEDLKNE